MAFCISGGYMAPVWFLAHYCYLSTAPSRPASLPVSLAWAHLLDQRVTGGANLAGVGIVAAQCRRC